MGQVLDDTVVGIAVEDMEISGLQDPVRLTFAHRQLPPVSWMCPPSPCMSTEAQAHTTLPFAECHPAVCLLGAQPRYWSGAGFWCSGVGESWREVALGTPAELPKASGQGMNGPLPCQGPHCCVESAGDAEGFVLGMLCCWDMALALCSCWAGVPQRYQTIHGTLCATLLASVLPPPSHQEALQLPHLCLRVSVGWDGGLGWRMLAWCSLLSPCAGCRAGRGLEHYRMCHSAWGQADRLFLQPSHLLHSPPGDNPIPYSSCFYPGYAASPSLTYLVPQVSPLAAQSFLLPGKPRPFLKRTSAPASCPRRQEHISRGYKGWTWPDSGSTETQGPFPHLVPTPRERLHLLRPTPTSTLPEGSGLVRSCSTSTGVLLLCCRTPRSPVVLTAVARFSRLVWAHLTQGARVWQNPALSRFMAQTVVAVANTSCGVAVAFSIFTIAFYIFLR